MKNIDIRYARLLRYLSDNDLSILEAKKLLWQYDNNINKCLEIFHSDAYKKLRYILGNCFDMKITWHRNIGRIPKYTNGEESVIVKFHDNSIGYMSPPTNYKWSIFLNPKEHRICYYAIIPYSYVTGNLISKLTNEGLL